LHSLPFNIMRMKYGLSEFLLDIKQIYTCGDFIVYPDAREIVPAYDLPANHTYLGPVLWSPEVSLPEWWETLPDDRQIVYIGLGSSGQHALMNAMIEAFGDLPVNVIVATASRSKIDNWPENFYTASYLPGLKAAEKSDLVLCAGGSMPAQQSLAAGAPILAIVSNADQLVYARAVRRAGAGEVLVEAEANAQTIKDTARKMLADASYKKAAANIARAFGRYNAGERFAQLVNSIIAGM
jgi:UDP:flavonoid glycosyltransferase YjiC (YdhE family)